MAIRMTVEHGMALPATRETGWISEWVKESFDVDLISYDEMEFVDEDIDEMMAAKILGFDDYDILLDFYKKYTKENGFRSFLWQNMDAFYDALEEQGYENFNYGDFSPEQFALILAGLLEYGSTQGDAGDLLEELVASPDDDEYEEGAAFDAYTQAVQDKVEGLINDLKDLHHPSDIERIKEILDELMLYIDRDGFSYREPDITPPWGDSDYEGPDFNAKKFEPRIEILGDTIYEWERYIRNEINDPIHFESSLIDYGEHSDSYCAPEAALKILEYFGEKESEYNEDNPDSPEPPEHPEPDKNGEFGVLYQRRKWSNADEFVEETLVPYEDESDMNTAIELSTYIFKEWGQKDLWNIKPVEKIDGQWYEYGEYDEDEE